MSTVTMPENGGELKIETPHGTVLVHTYRYIGTQVSVYDKDNPDVLLGLIHLKSKEAE